MYSALLTKMSSLVYYSYCSLASLLLVAVPSCSMRHSIALSLYFLCAMAVKLNIIYSNRMEKKRCNHDNSLRRRYAYRCALLTLDSAGHRSRENIYASIYVCSFLYHEAYITIQERELRQFLTEKKCNIPGLKD